MVHALLYFGATVCGAAAVGYFTAAWLGWCILSIGLGVQLVFHLKNFMRLDDWSRNPQVDASLTGGGLWGGVFGRMYRHEKDLYAQIARRDYELGLFTAAAQALTDGVVLLDRHFRIVFCNTIAEDQLGLSLTRDTEQTITHLIRQPDFVSYIHNADYTQPLTMHSERDRRRVFSVFIIPFAGNRQLMQIKDITQATRIEQMRRDFVANVSHELRTPLTVLSGFLEFIQDMNPDAAERDHYLVMMADQTRRMQSIVQDLLTLSVIESAPPPDNDLVDMHLMMEKLHQDALALSNGGHEIVMENRSDFDLLGSEAELVGAFGNLVSNAVRYTPAGGRIILRWEKQARGASFCVQDTGIGIESQHIPRLTERFYRVDRGRSREAGGTGLGLAIVKHTLNRHQAWLEIHSTPGKGSTFTVHFPESSLAFA